MFNVAKFRSFLKHPGYNDPITATIVAAGVGAAGQVYSAKQQAKATKNAANAQREATAAQGRAAAVESQQARLAQVREARIRRGQVIAAGGNAGLGFSGSSGTQGAIGSIASQMAGNIGIINQEQTFAQETSTALQKATDYGVQAQKWQMIGDFSKSIFQQAGGFTTIFGGNTNVGVK